MYCRQDGPHSPLGYRYHAKLEQDYGGLAPNLPGPPDARTLVEMAGKNWKLVTLGCGMSLLILTTLPETNLAPENGWLEY